MDRQARVSHVQSHVCTWTILRSKRRRVRVRVPRRILLRSRDQKLQESARRADEIATCRTVRHTQPSRNQVEPATSTCTCLGQRRVGRSIPKQKPSRELCGRILLRSRHQSVRAAVRTRIRLRQNQERMRAGRRKDTTTRLRMHACCSYS